ncbi:MLO-like protein 1 isoform X1 [Gossypium australe]|uniref:MLO-like protein 1 isoform X1 n=1 Tax=Gossypium australe TaxID=47621 RepID=A0A5B6X096_9ROSI|nr:MLO-like protein 1 isoform X1 [Gossypium australe]
MPRALRHSVVSPSCSVAIRVLWEKAVVNEIPSDSLNRVNICFCRRHDRVVDEGMAVRKTRPCGPHGLGQDECMGYTSMWAHTGSVLYGVIVYILDFAYLFLLSESESETVSDCMYDSVILRLRQIDSAIMSRLDMGCYTYYGARKTPSMEFVDSSGEEELCALAILA